MSNPHWEKVKKSYANKRVLITGADGFIGSHLTRALAQLGALVHAAVHSTERAWRLKDLVGKMEIYEANLTNIVDADRVMSTSKPDIVFNVASRVDTRRDVTLLEEIIHNTYGISHNALSAALRAGAGTFVQFGTIEEYGSNTAPFREDMREKPVSPYSLGKTMATHEALLIGTSSDMCVCVVRPAATFGPRQGPGMLTPNFLKAALAGENFGMNTGEQLRDFVFVDDLVEGVLLAGASERANGETINLGSGRGMQVREFVEMLNSAMGKPIQVNFGAHPYRANDSMEFYMDSTKAKKLLGWEATTNIKEAIKMTVAWYRSNEDVLNRRA